MNFDKPFNIPDGIFGDDVRVADINSLLIEMNTWSSQIIETNLEHLNTVDQDIKVWSVMFGQCSVQSDLKMGATEDLSQFTNDAKKVAQFMQAYDSHIDSLQIGKKYIALSEQHYEIYIVEIQKILEHIVVFVNNAGTSSSPVGLQPAPDSPDLDYYDKIIGIVEQLFNTITAIKNDVNRISINTHIKESTDDIRELLRVLMFLGRTHQRRKAYSLVTRYNLYNLFNQYAIPPLQRVLVTFGILIKKVEFAEDLDFRQNLTDLHSFTSTDINVSMNTALERYLESMRVSTDLDEISLDKRPFELSHDISKVNSDNLLHFAKDLYQLHRLLTYDTIFHQFLNLERNGVKYHLNIKDRLAKVQDYKGLIEEMLFWSAGPLIDSNFNSLAEVRAVLNGKTFNRPQNDTSIIGYLFQGDNDDLYRDFIKQIAVDSDSDVLKIRIELLLKFIINAILKFPTNNTSDTEPYKAAATLLNMIISRIRNHSQNFDMLRTQLKSVQAHLYSDDMLIKTKMLSFIKIRNDLLDEGNELRYDIRVDKGHHSMIVKYHGVEAQLYEDAAWHIRQNQQKLLGVDVSSERPVFSARPGSIRNATVNAMELPDGERHESYSFHDYMFGPFTKIFLPEDKTEKIAEMSIIKTALIDKLKARKNVCIFGNGQSGVGKTSYLFFRKTGIKDEDGEHGLLYYICNTLAATYTTARVNIVEIGGEIKDGVTTETKLPRLDVFGPTDVTSTDNYTDRWYQTKEFRSDGKIWTLSATDQQKRSPSIFDAKTGLPGVKLNRLNKQIASETDTIDSSMLKQLCSYVYYVIENNRKTKPTTNNATSSRSHILVNITFVNRDGQTVTLAVYDFGGVENSFRCENLDTLKQFAGLTFPSKPGRAYQQEIDKFLENADSDISKAMKNFETKNVSTEGVITNRKSWFANKNIAIIDEEFRDVISTIRSGAAGMTQEIGKKMIARCRRVAKHVVELTNKELSTPDPKNPKEKMPFYKTTFNRIIQAIEFLSNPTSQFIIPAGVNTGVKTRVKNSIPEESHSQTIDVLRTGIYTQAFNEIRFTAALLDNIPFDTDKSLRVMRFAIIRAVDPEHGVPPPTINGKFRGHDSIPMGPRPIYLHAIHAAGQPLPGTDLNRYDVLAYMILKESISLFMRDECQARRSEGNWINKTLSNFKNVITKVQNPRGNYPNSIGVCEALQCSPFYMDCYESDVKVEIGEVEYQLARAFKPGLEERTFDGVQQALKDVTFCIFNIINISKNRNDPPEPPFIDPSPIIFEYNRYMNSRYAIQKNDGTHVDEELTAHLSNGEFDRSVIDTMINRINSFSTIDDDVKLELLGKLTVINRDSPKWAASVVRSHMKDLIAYFEKINAPTLLGTLITTLNFSTLGNINSMCVLNTNSQHSKELTTEYFDKVLFGNYGKLEKLFAKYQPIQTQWVVQPEFKEQEYVISIDDEEVKDDEMVADELQNK